MGYTTEFELEIIEGEKVYNGYHEELIVSELGFNPFSGCGVKWSAWNNDMISFSKKFPTVVFQIEGNGESWGDLWRAYFKNGKHQFEPAVIKFKKYKESKLK